MDASLLHQIDPIGSGLTGSFYWSLGFLLLFVGFFWLLQKRQISGLDRNRKLVLSMLCFFGFLITMGVAFFSWWNSLRVGPIKIYSDAVETAYGRSEFKDIVNLQIRKESQPSLLPVSNNQKGLQYLLIEDSKQKVHILSEENYELDRILEKLQNSREAWKKKKAES